jgi:hypothetical protein
MRLSPAIAAFALVGVTGCAPAATSTATPTVTATVTQPPPSAEPGPDPSTAPPAGHTPRPRTAARLPDAVGMNLQAAQDLLQDRGFYLLDDQDVTGQNRLQVYDRNWVVVRQTPAAGKRVPTTTRVVLYAKKRGE